MSHKTQAAMIKFLLTEKNKGLKNFTKYVKGK